MGTIVKGDGIGHGGRAFVVVADSILFVFHQADRVRPQPESISVVLDLKAPEVPPEALSDPSSPFVSPEAEDTLPVELAPKQTDEQEVFEPQPELLTVPEDKGNEPVAPSASPVSPEAGDDSAVPPEMEVEFNEELLEWGPKLAPEQREFQPVPPQRSGGTGAHTEISTISTPQHNLGREESVAALLPPPKSVEKALATPDWADPVPASPVSVAPAAATSEAAPAAVD